MRASHAFLFGGDRKAKATYDELRVKAKASLESLRKSGRTKASKEEGLFKQVRKLKWDWGWLACGLMQCRQLFPESETGLILRAMGKRSAVGKVQVSTNDG